MHFHYNKETLHYLYTYISRLIHSQYVNAKGKFSSALISALSENISIYIEIALTALLVFERD